MSNNRAPTYEKSVQAEITQSPEIASSANMMINAWKSFANTGSEISQYVSKKYETEQRDTLQHNMSTAYKKFGDAALNEPNADLALKNYDQSISEYQKTIVGETGSFNKKYVETLSNYYGEQHREPAFKNAVAANRRQLDDNFAKNDSTQINDINNAISDNVDGNYQGAYEFLNLREKSLEKGFLNKNITTRSAYETASKQNKTEFASNVIIQQLKNSLTNGTQDKFWNDFHNRSLHGSEFLDEKETVVLGKLLTNVQTSFGNNGLNNVSDIKLRMSSNIDAVHAGGTSQGASLLPIAKGLLKPYEFEQYKSQYELAPIVAANLKATTNASPSVTNASVESLKPSVDDPNYKTDYAIYTATKAKIAERRKKYEDDPTQYGIDNDPTVKAVAQQHQVAVNAGASTTNYKNTPFNIYSQDYTDANYQYQLSMGTKSSDFKPLTKLVAQDFAIQFQKATPEQEIKMLVDLRTQFPTEDKFKSAFKQIHDFGVHSGFSALANYEPNDPNALLVADAFKRNTPELVKAVGKENVDKFNTDIDNLFTDSTFTKQGIQGLMQSIDGYGSGDRVGFVNDMKDQMRQLTYYASANNIANPVKWASDRLTNNYQFGTFDGQTLRVPKNISLESVYNYASYQKSKLGEFNYLMPTRFVDAALAKGTSLSEIQKEYKEKVVDTGHFVTNTLGTGAIWVSTNGEAIADANGNAFEFSYANAAKFEDNTYTSRLKLLNTASWYMNETPYNMLYKQMKRFLPEEKDPYKNDNSDLVAKINAVKLEEKKPEVKKEIESGKGLLKESGNILKSVNEEHERIDSLYDIIDSPTAGKDEIDQAESELTRINYNNSVKWGKNHPKERAAMIEYEKESNRIIMEERKKSKEKKERKKILEESK